MGCEEVRDLVDIVAAGEAPDAQRLAVEEHCTRCASCAKELDLYREARAHLALLREGDAPPGTWKSLWADVRADLFPRKPSRSVARFDASLRYAAVVMVGVAIGVGTHVATRPAASGPAAAAPVADSGRVSAPVHAVTTSEPAPFRIEVAPRSRFFAPRVKPDGNAWLPRVEAIPVGGERDY